MEDLIYGILITIGVVVVIALAIFFALLPTIACYRTRRLNHIYHQLNQIIELLGGKPYNEDDEEDDEDNENNV